jgi:hypothetical protein
MEDREAFVLLPKVTIVDSPDEAILHLKMSMSLLTSIVKEMMLRYDLQIDEDTEDAFGIIDQSVQALNMYLERLGLWNSKS